MGAVRNGFFLKRADKFGTTIAIIILPCIMQTMIMMMSERSLISVPDLYCSVTICSVPTLLDILDYPNMHTVVPDASKIGGTIKITSKCYTNSYRR